MLSTLLGAGASRTVPVTTNCHNLGLDSLRLSRSKCDVDMVLGLSSSFSSRVCYGTLCRVYSTVTA